MRRILLFIALTASFIYSGAVKIPEKMESFRDASLLLLKGIDDKDEIPLIDAAEIFGSLDISDYTEFRFIGSGAISISNPTIYFDSSFCDNVRLAQGEIVKMDHLSALRACAMPEELLVINRDIAPGAKVKLSFEGTDEMNMLLISAVPDALDCTIETAGKEIPMENLNDNHSSFAAWNMGPDLEDVILTLTNKADREVSFAIVLE